MKILIVEDEPLVAEDLKETLELLDYDVVGVAESYEEAAPVLAENTVDLAMLDVNIEGDMDGIDLAQHIRGKYDCKIVFLTSFSDRKTIERIQVVQPDGYLVKPYKKEDIKATLGVLDSHQSSNTKTSKHQPILIKDKLDHVKIDPAEILYLKAENNYCKVVTSARNYLLSITLKAVLEKLPDDLVKRCHRTYAVNIDSIGRVGGNYIVVNDESIPINDAFKHFINGYFRKV